MTEQPPRIAVLRSRDAGPEPVDLDPAWVIERRAIHAAVGRLRRQRPGAVVNAIGSEQAPFEIWLAASAETAAGELWERFGSAVRLTVGVLDYPPRSGQCWPGRAVLPHKAIPTPLDPAEVTVRLDGPLQIATGQTLRHGLILSNHSDNAIVVVNHDLDATIVDPVTGQPVGGYVGGHLGVGRRFTAQPSGEVTVELQVGTASYHADLGYTVPPGQWALTATLHTVGGGVWLTPALAFTITD